MKQVGQFGTLQKAPFPIGKHLFMVHDVISGADNLKRMADFFISIQFVKIAAGYFGVTAPIMFFKQFFVFGCVYISHKISPFVLRDTSSRLIFI